MKLSKSNQTIQRNSAMREKGKVGMLQHNKDRMGSNSGPMGVEDQRKDKYGSVHNQDPQGLRSDETREVRKEMKVARQKLRKHKRLGSR